MAAFLVQYIRRVATIFTPILTPENPNGKNKYSEKYSDDCVAISGCGSDGLPAALREAVVVIF